MTDVIYEPQEDLKFNVLNHNGAVLGIITYDNVHESCMFEQKLASVSAYQLKYVVKYMDEITKKLS